MENYYIKTLVAAAIKLGPPILFLVGGYLIFIKLPFLFLRRSMKEQKGILEEERKKNEAVEARYTLEDYKKFQQQMKLMDPALGKTGEMRPETKKESTPLTLEAPRAQNTKRTEQKPREEKKNEPPKRETAREKSDEEILGFKPGDRFSMNELKKRYIELIRQNHPDKVASMGPDFKKLAEKNTKEINKAFDKLKKKAS